MFVLSRHPRPPVKKSVSNLRGNPYLPPLLNVNSNQAPGNPGKRLKSTGLPRLLTGTGAWSGLLRKDSIVGDAWAPGQTVFV